MSSRLARCSAFGVVLALTGLLFPAVSPAADEAASPLPLDTVVLFSSGVGFFEHHGEITGNAQVDLKFNVDDINDLLKSMVLRDLGGGQISTVNYGSKDPITRTLKTFAIDLTSNPTLATLLGQIRGEKVQIDAPNQIVGTIIGVEPRRQKVGDQIIETQVLNLLTEEGLRSVPLEGIGKIKLVNPQLDAELRQALTILAMGHSTDKKTVKLNFRGEGKRPVRVGYIQETPVWKTSYRLELGEDEGPFLQGWAIVENTTEEDWKDVKLTLISGRPISFRMDLYQPLYVARPVVVPELFASLRPRVYDQDLAANEAEFKQRAEMAEKDGLVADQAKKADGRARRAVELAAAAPGFGGEGKGEGRGGQNRQLGLQQGGVQSAAQAGNVGEFFQYAIETPVNLPRQESAMLPIVNEAIEGQKVSIYNANVHAKHPLNGLRFKNSTRLHLMQGPITVFDGGAYAGDAQIEDLPPGSERLISYAMDLDTEVAPQGQAQVESLVTCRLVKGTIYTKHKYERAQSYIIKNSGRHAKEVLIEHPLDPNWTLVAPEKPAEKTRGMYRFQVTAEPGKPAVLLIKEERVQDQQVAVNNLDDNAIRVFISAPVVSEKVKKALNETIARKLKLQQVAAKRQGFEQQIAVVEAEQNRIRQNMAQLEKNSDLYNRYVKKFDDQETQVEKLRKQIEGAKEEEATQRQALDEFLAGLELD